MKKELPSDVIPFLKKVRAKPAYDLAREAARLTDERRAQLGSEIGIRPDPLSSSRNFLEK